MILTNVLKIMSKKKKFPKILKDALLIIVSVLFALFINEWRSNINKKKETKIILENINQELENNLKSAKQLRLYHLEVRDNLFRAYEKDSLMATFFDDFLFTIYKIAPKGILQEDFSSIAWEVARQENISSRIDFETSRLLFEAYDQQKSVLKTVNELLQVLDQREAQRKENLTESIILIGRHLNEVIGQEEDMITNYQLALEPINSKE